MISDTLSEAVEDIDGYLACDGMYTGPLRADIIALRDAMEAMRIRLDTPPAPQSDASP